MQSFKEFINENGDKPKSDTESQYEIFFQKTLDKWGVDSPDELDDAEQKKFFDYLDANWTADDE